MTEERLHSTFSLTPFTTSGGRVWMSGPQLTSCVPEWVAKVMNDHPEITQLVVNTETNSVVYQRLEAS